MCTNQDAQVVQARVDEWRRQADQIRQVEQAKRESSAQSASSLRLSLFLATTLKGVGNVFIRASDRLDVRYNCRQPNIACE